MSSVESVRALIREVLADHQPHSAAEVIELAGARILPGPAKRHADKIRRWAKESARRQRGSTDMEGESLRPRSIEESVSVGRRSLVIRTLHAMVAERKIEVIVRGDRRTWTGPYAALIRLPRPLWSAQEMSQAIGCSPSKMHDLVPLGQAEGLTVTKVHVGQRRVIRLLDPGQAPQWAALRGRTCRVGVPPTLRWAAYNERYDALWNVKEKSWEVAKNEAGEPCPYFRDAEPPRYVRDLNWATATEES